MRKKRLRSLALLLAGVLMAVLLSGCMAFDVVLSINEAGSGKLVYDVLWKVEYAETAMGELPDGTAKVESITIEGQEYTGYRVTQNFTTLDELESILLEKSGEDEFTVDEETGLRSASAFRLGNFIDEVSVKKNDLSETMDLQLVFSAIDVGSMVSTEEQGLTNQDLFTIRLNIIMPGTIVNASSNLAAIELDEGSAKILFTPNEKQVTTISLSSDYSGNIYIYSDREPPKESYTFTSDAAANQALDEETRAQIAQDPIYAKENKDGGAPNATLVYIAAAGVFILACAGVLAWRFMHVRVDTEQDKAYQRKLKRDERLEEEYKQTSGKIHKPNKKK